MTRWRRYGEAIVRYRWLVGVLVVALLLDVLFFTGYYAFDDKDYTWAAHQIAHGENFMLPRASNYELAAVRLGFNLPLALVNRLSDGSIAWMSAFQMLYHLGCVVIAYALARTIANERAGRIAAVIAATCPLLYNFAGVMLPDVALAMWAGLSLLLLVRAIHRAKNPDEPGWKSSRLFVASGLALGIAYSVKATAILLCFPSAIAIIAAFPSLRQPKKWLVHGAWLALGVALMLLVELVVFRAVTGDWISQLTIAQDSTGWDFPRWMAKQGTNPFARIWFAVVKLREHMPITFVAFAAGLVAQTISRRRNVTIVVFAWFTFLYLTIGTASLTKYLPQPIFPRYYTLFIIPAIVALSCAITFGLEWYATWERRPRRATPLVLAVGLIVFGAGTAAYELRANLPLAGAIPNSEWARSFAQAYEKANQEYPQYPIVLSMEVSFTLLPILLPNIPDHVYWNAPGEPWGNDHKATPKPPFIFLDWTRGSTRSGLARIEGVDLEHVDVETVAIVRAEAGAGAGRVRQALHTLMGLEPTAVTTQTTTWNATTIQLVRPAAGRSDATPTVQVHMDGGTGVSINNDANGVSLQWDWPTRFDISYFDNDDRFYNPNAITDTIDPPAKEITVAFGASSFRGGIITGAIEIIAYGGDHKVVDRATRPLAVIGGVQNIAATLRGDIHEYRVRASINSPTLGGLHLDPIEVTSVPTESTARIVGAAKPAEVVALTKGDFKIRNEGAVTSVRWGQVAKRFAIQYFDDRNYRRSPRSESSRLRAATRTNMFVVSGGIRQLEGAPLTADVEVFAYGEDRELSGQATRRITLGSTFTPFVIPVVSTRQGASAYRIRVWLEGSGPAAIELAPVEATTIPVPSLREMR